MPTPKTTPTVGKQSDIKKFRYVVGIDPGVNTGLAIWDAEFSCFVVVGCYAIHSVMEHLKTLSERATVLVRVEDARQRKWFGKAGREQLQGAGSIKRDCGIWEAFLTDQGIAFEMVPPKNNRTKMDAQTFKNYTKWRERTNEHSRDAAALCFNHSGNYTPVASLAANTAAIGRGMSKDINQD